MGTQNEMSAGEIKHFLLVYDIAGASADVESFDTDYERAVEAYNTAEHEHRDDPDVEVVILGSDSVETLARTTLELLAAAGEAPG